MSDSGPDTETATRSESGGPTRRRVFSGIQPTGAPHVGNYLGAILNWVKLQQSHDTIYCIVDHHATTVAYDPADFRAAILEMSIALLAAGVDPDRSIFYVQSMVPEHTELAWIFNTVTMFGDLGRMTQFKDKSEQNQNNVNVGLFTYPVLQAADILLYKAGWVPVGEDQVQHLELSRDIARRWNRRFTADYFPEPQPLLTPARRIIGLDGKQKMSKSKNNHLPLVDSFEERWERLRPAYTDPQRLRRTDPGDPGVCNMFSLHEYFSDQAIIDRVDRECRTAEIGCFDCKKLLNQSIEDEIGPIRDATERWRQRPDDVWDILRAGGARARAIARETMAHVREAMGLPGAVD